MTAIWAHLGRAYSVCLSLLSVRWHVPWDATLIRPWGGPVVLLCHKRQMTDSSNEVYNHRGKSVKAAKTSIALRDDQRVCSLLCSKVSGRPAGIRDSVPSWNIIHAAVWCKPCDQMAVGLGDIVFKKLISWFFFPTLSQNIIISIFMSKIVILFNQRNDRFNHCHQLDSKSLKQEVKYS